MTAVNIRERIAAKFPHAKKVGSMKVSYSKPSTLETAREATRKSLMDSLKFLAGTGVEPKLKCYKPLGQLGYLVGPRFGNRWLKDADGTDHAYEVANKGQAMEMLEELALGVEDGDFDHLIEIQRQAHHSFTK